ncbi:Nitroreductase [uncultured Desulfobacterium sp.]|uniref:Nitroreductase n=1 Tax=uncultured Desulfobacterium sp. TaxID=201089 RepID=A0A445MU68_9BACT|nr:Nitroreductase [uncultured Desulfobacterium sp.]
MDRIISFDELVNKRRSIRKYKTDTPPEQWIEMMILSAAMVPSPSNTQPVRFLKVNSSGIRDRLHENMALGRQRLFDTLEERNGPKRLKNWITSYYRFSEFMFNAPLLFAAGTLKATTGFSRKLFEAGLIERYDRKDLDITIGLALQAFILKGEELGLGSCILTAPLVFISNVENILGIGDLDIRCLITVGFPDETPGPIQRKTVYEVYRTV